MCYLVFQVKMKLRILTKREQTREERVLALTAETKNLKSEDKSLKVCVVCIVLRTRISYHIMNLSRIPVSKDRMWIIALRLRSIYLLRYGLKNYPTLITSSLS